MYNKGRCHDQCGSCSGPNNLVLYTLANITKVNTMELTCMKAKNLTILKYVNVCAEFTNVAVNSLQHCSSNYGVTCTESKESYDIKVKLLILLHCYCSA